MSTDPKNPNPTGPNQEYSLVDQAAYYASLIATSVTPEGSVNIGEACNNVSSTTQMAACDGVSDALHKTPLHTLSTETNPTGPDRDYNPLDQAVYHTSHTGASLAPEGLIAIGEACNNISSATQMAMCDGMSDALHETPSNGLPAEVNKQPDGKSALPSK